MSPVRSTAPKSADVPAATPPPPPSTDKAAPKNEVKATVSVEVLPDEIEFPKVVGRGGQRKESEHDKLVREYIASPGTRVVRGLINDKTKANNYQSGLRNAAKRVNRKLVWREVPEDYMVDGKPHPAAGAHVWRLEDADD